MYIGVVILSFFFLSCATENKLDISKYNIFNYDNYVHSLEREIQNPNGKIEWEPERKALELAINSLGKSKNFQITLNLVLENCNFGEKGCKFIARTFPDGKIEIFSGILNEFDSQIMQRKAYPVNQKSLRLSYLSALAAHEYCHLLNQDFEKKRQVHKSLDDKESITSFMRSLEIEADTCSIQVMRDLNQDTEYIVLTLKILKELYSKRNENIENRTDFYDYTYLHPSPNKRISSILKTMSLSHWELYEKLSELEELFSIVRRSGSYEDLPVLEKALSKIEEYIEKNQHSHSQILLELKTVYTLGSHKLWYLENRPKELQFLGVIEIPLFSDMKEFSDIKGEAEFKEKYFKIKGLYLDLISDTNIVKMDNYPEILSAYSLFLVYSPNMEDKKQALEFSKKAIQKKKIFSIVTNHAIILYRLGQKIDAKNIFKQIYQNSRTGYLEKSVYPELESHFYENAEKMIASLNYVSILLEGNKKEVLDSESILSQNLNGEHSWTRYVKGKYQNLSKKGN